MGRAPRWEPAPCQFCNVSRAFRLPPSSAADRYAILFRGEAYRWGCSAKGAELQRVAFGSQIANLVEPLSALGHAVKVYLTFDDWRVCINKNASKSVLTASVAVKRLATAVPATALATLKILGGIRDQPDGILKALSTFMPSASAFEYLVITRYDVRLLTPINAWPCYGDRNRISAASKCEPTAWNHFNCIADHFWIVPRPHMRPFGAIVGKRLNLSHFTKCCYSKRCIHKAGHGCFNVLTHVLGNESVGFCWPQPARSVAEPNKNYQCCKHGRAGVALTGLAQRHGNEEVAAAGPGAGGGL